MAAASRPALCALLLLAACARREPGQIAAPTLSVTGFTVVSEQAVGPTEVESVLRAECVNGGPTVLGVSAVIESLEPGASVVDGALRCGLVPGGQRAATLDTITIRRPASSALDPSSLRFLALTWGADTHVDDGAVPADDVVAISHFVDLTNALGRDVGVVALASSTSPATVVLDGAISAPRVPDGRRLSTRDRFSLRHDRAVPIDLDVLDFALRLTPARTGDLDRDGDVDARDVQLAVACRHQDPAARCDCAAADMDGDGDIDTADLDAVARARGPRDLPVAPPDPDAPVVSVTEPQDGAAIPASPVRVAGTLGEPAFRLTVDGVAAAVSPLQPYGWSADVPLAPGAAALEIVATDLACNTSRRTVPIVFGGGDALAPRVTLSAPATVQAGTAFRVVLDASDDGPLASLELQVDGAVVATAATAPLVLDAVAPDLPGATLSLRGVARDAAGNAGEATGSVVLADQPDTSPPAVTALLLPPSAAPGTRFRARAEVRDDRGVREVRFSLAGGAPLVDAAPPFEVELKVPPDAAPGSAIAVGAEAVDDADLTGSASGTVQIVADADVSSPFGVILQAPAEAVAGAGVVLSATASDDVGVALVRFFAGTQLVGEDALPPYEIGATLPPSAQPGASVTWRATALDFAGNAAHAAPVATRVVAPRGGAVAGEVYDDATGRPLAGATVRVLSAGGAAQDVPVSATTDARGRYRFVLGEGQATLTVERSGYTSARRSAEVPPGGIATPLDARLAPVAASSPLTRRDGGVLELGDGSARVEVAPGALAADATLGLQPLGPQGLPAPLPLGWSPLVGLAVESAGVAFAAPVLVELRGAAAAEASAGAAGGPILAAYDATSGEWRRAAPEPGAAPGSARVALAQPGAVAVVRADVAPATPPAPAAGETLSGVAPAPLPAGASAELLPSPRIVFAGADARADVALRIAAASPLPSGTPLAVAWSERYERIDGSRLAPEPMEQDLLVYASGGGPRADFVATPTPEVDALSLREGSIDLTAAPPTPDRASGILTPAGGRLSTPGGVSLEVLAGALSAPVVATVETFGPATLGLADDVRFVPVGGFAIDLGGAPLAAAALLGVPRPAGVPVGDTLLLARVSSIGGTSELELVGLAQTAPGGLVVGAGGAGQPFPGVRGEGRYVLVQATAPLGFVTGSVLGGAAAPPVVRAGGTPFVARAHDDPAAGAPRFALASPLGDIVLEASDPITGDSARISVRLATAGAAVAQDVSLAPTPLRVAAIDPPDGAVDVAADAAVRVRFDRAVDPASVGAAAAALRVGVADLPADVALAADGATLVLRPRAPLAGETLHALRLAPTLRDVFGRTLAGGQPDGSFASAFTTADTTPPPRPAAGQVTIGIPANGAVRIAGTQGAAEPGVLVLARNDSTNATASVLAGADGSFAFDLPAGLPDRVTLVYRDAAGRETSFDPGPFTGPDGTVVIGSGGGVVTGAGGVQAIVPPGVVPDGTPIRVGAIVGAALATPIPSFMDFLTAFEIDMGAVKASDEIDISVPIPAGTAVDPRQDFYVFLERDVFGQGMYELVNVAHAVGGRIETASPPFPGVRQSGRYFLGPPNLSLAIVAMTLAPSFSFSLAFGAAVPVLSAAANNLASSLDAMPIFAVPVDQPFTVTVFGQNAQPLLTLPFGAIPVAGITNLVVPPPDDGSPFEATTILPADGSIEVFNRPTIRVVFNKELDEASAQQHFQLVDPTASGSAAIVPGQISFESVNGAARVVVFRPSARLKFGADYEIRMQGICPFGQTQSGACQMPLTTTTSSFRTFAPRALGSVAVGNPNDVSAWRPGPGLPVDRLLVANGTNADADSTGVVVLDVADPAAPVKLSERAIVGRTFAALGIDDANLVATDGSKSLSGPVALSASGGVNSISNLRVLAPTPDRSAVTSEGATLLSSSLAALQNGITLADIPPFVGSPNDLAFLPGDPNGAAYVATIGIGVQGVDLGLTLGTIRRQPGLFAFESVNSVETIGDHVVAGDRNQLVVLDGQLNLVATAPIGARALHAVKAYSADFDGDGVIDPVSEVRDLVLAATDTPSRRITLVDVSQPAFPFELAVVELPSTPRDIFLDRVERMAYVATPAGVEIVDFSDPDAGGGGPVDANGDGRDDRLLGRVAGIPTAGSIDVSDDGATGYVGAASGTTGEVYTALLSSGRFYVDFQDPQFPSSKLRPADYYPSLGTRRFHVRGFEQDGTPGSGSVTATVISPVAGVSIPGGVSMANGIAELSFSAPALLPTSGPIELELEWTDATGVTLRVRQKFTVRNNSITNLQEVLDGRAVFVAGTGTGAGHAGVTPRPKQPIAPGYDPTPRPRSFAPLDERRWDFVEEMFNQTLLRKRSYAQSVAPLFPFLENGDYATEDELAVEAVKREFRITVNTAAANRSQNFLKLMKDYGIAAGSQDAYHDKIVDRETLVMDTMRVQPDIDQPCSPCDFEINPTTGGDTGLYELYTNVVFRFIEDMIDRAEQYRDGSNPSNADALWISRDGISTPPAPLDFDSIALSDGRPGVAYGFGSKLTLEDFNAKVSRFGAPDAATILALPPVGFRTYRGQIFDDVAPGTVAPPGTDPLTTKMWSGIKQAEINFNTLASPFYPPAYWAGIDCAGLVQRIALHARDRSPAKLLPYFFNAKTNCDDGIPTTGVGLCDVRVQANGWWVGAILGRDFWNREPVATNIWANGSLQMPVHRGDQRVSQSHVSTLYSDPIQPTDDYYLIHAYGDNRYREGVKGNGTHRFGRKVIVSGWRGHHGAWGVSRLKLWE